MKLQQIKLKLWLVAAAILSALPAGIRVGGGIELVSQSQPQARREFFAHDIFRRWWRGRQRACDDHAAAGKCIFHTTAIGVLNT